MHARRCPGLDAAEGKSGGLCPWSDSCHSALVIKVGLLSDQCCGGPPIEGGGRAMTYTGPLAEASCWGGCGCKGARERVWGKRLCCRRSGELGNLSRGEATAPCGGEDAGQAATGEATVPETGRAPPPSRAASTGPGQTEENRCSPRIFNQKRLRFLPPTFLKRTISRHV